MPSYPALARCIREHPSFQVFRTYSELNLKSILYYQAELAHLEQQLAEAEVEDQSDGDITSIRMQCSKHWQSLRYGRDKVSSVLTSDTAPSVHSGPGGERSRSLSPRTTDSRPFHKFEDNRR
jgi:hypothetical protein